MSHPLTSIYSFSDYILFPFLKIGDFPISVIQHLLKYLFQKRGKFDMCWVFIMLQALS